MYQHMPRGRHACADTNFPISSAFPVRVHVEPTDAPRNRLTTLFRPFIALPHLVLVGGPVAGVLWWTWSAEPNGRDD